MESKELILVYYIGTFAMILLAVAIFFFFITYQKRLLKKQLEINEVKAAQQEQLLQNTILAQEKERRRVARDLHDEVGAMLSVVKLNVGRLEKKMIESSAKELVVETKTYLDDVITQVRRISRALLPPSLEKFGLFNAIEELGRWVNKSEIINVECLLIGKQYRLDTEKELALFRIVQELINNSLKHAAANKITVVLRYSPNLLCVNYQDNGIGFDLEEKISTGLGLKNLESRTQLLKAKFKMKSKPGAGTSAILCLKTDS
ncbi:MAG: sensor histidine kinase [Prolixibacteraceae bacterium]|nr:sensor histidine kinase [Prolixibacteraceae bacterium]